MRFNVSSKLMLLTGVGILCSTGLTIAALVGFSRVQNRLAEVAVSAQAMRNHLEGDMMHDALRGDVLFAFVASNDEERALAAEEFNAHADWFKKCIQANAELDLPAPVRSSIAEVAPAIDEYIAASEIMYTRALKDPAEARAGLAEFQAAFSALEEKTESLSDRISAHAEETEAHAKQYIRAASTWMIASVCAGAGCSAFIGWFISRGIVRPLARCVGVMEAIASGNLTARVSITQHDEIGRLAAAADIAAESMSRMVREIASASSQVASASTEIAATSRSMSSSIESQSREIAEITSAVTEVSNATSDVARRSEEASRSAADSGRLARSGGDVVTKTIEGIAGITESVRAGTASVTELGKRGEQIGKIIGVINDIADQTNLLALNAAIEAARAGDHGRGFAVVADEVRKLADRTTKATDEIGESIRAIQTETTQAVERMNAGNERVKQGSTLAAEAGKSLESIVEASTSVGSMIEHIAAAATEQLESTRHMAERIESIRRVSEDAHVGAVNTSEAANVLSIKAEELNRLVSRFTVEAGHAHQPSA